MLATWEAEVEPFKNLKGPECHITLPTVNKNTIFNLNIRTKNGYETNYRYLLYGAEEENGQRFLNR